MTTELYTDLYTMVTNATMITHVNRCQPRQQRPPPRPPRETASLKIQINSVIRVHKKRLQTEGENIDKYYVQLCEMSRLYM